MTIESKKRLSREWLKHYKEHSVQNMITPMITSLIIFLKWQQKKCNLPKKQKLPLSEDLKNAKKVPTAEKAVKQNALK